MGGRGASSGGSNTGLTKSQKEFVSRQFTEEKAKKGKWRVGIGYENYTITANSNGTYNIRRANATYAKNVTADEGKRVLTSIVERENKAKINRQKIWNNKK